MKHRSGEGQIVMESKGKSCVRKCFQPDRIVLALALVFIWSLLALPVTFNILSQTAESNGEENITCTSSVLYYDQLECREALLNLATDLERRSALCLALYDVREEDNKNIYNHSRDLECSRKVLPFLCQYVFGSICQEQDKTYVLPTSEECFNMTTYVCPDILQEWPWNNTVERPNCSSLKSEATPGEEPSNCPLDCQEDFFCDNLTHKCLPRCPDFNFYSRTASQFADITIATSATLGLLAGIVVIIVSIIRRKTVLTFPSILAVYETITVMILNGLQIITFIGRGPLYCSSPNLIESYSNITPFCVLSGMTQVAYLPLQFNVWWVAHMWVLYATIRYPFKVMQSKKILKAVHVGVVIVGVLLPATPVLAGIVNDAIQCNVSGTAGVVLGTPPFTLCLVDDYIIFLLFIAGPNSIIALTGMTGLVLLIWTVHKKFGIIKTIRSVSKSPLNSTELKLLLVFSYFTLIEILFVLRASLTYEDFQDALEEYFTCEESGVDPSNPCVRNFGRVVAICAFTAQYSCILLIPAVCSVFVMDVGAVGASIKKIFLYIVSSLKSQ